MRPGIDIRPLIDMTGEHAFNEVFLTDVRIPADHLVGPEHAGWELAKVTLGNERVSLSGEGALWGMGPTAEDLVDLIRGAGGAPDPSTRDRLVDVWIEAQILRVLRLRMVSAVLAGRAPGAEASVRKAIADAHGQHIMDLGRDLAGPHAMLAGTGPVGGWGRSGATTPAPATPAPATPPATSRPPPRRPPPRRRHHAARLDLVPWLPVRPGPDRRRRHGRGPAQHRGRKGSRPAARSLILRRTHTYGGASAGAVCRRVRGTAARAVAHPGPDASGLVGIGSNEPTIGGVHAQSPSAGCRVGSNSCVVHAADQGRDGRLERSRSRRPGAASPGPRPR